MIARTWAGRRRAVEVTGHDHAHGAHDHHHAHDDHAHDHRDETRLVDSGHGKVEVSIFEEGQPPHWRFRSVSGQFWGAGEVTLETERPDGSRQTFRFAPKDGFLESTDAIPEPHSFMVWLTLSHGNHAHDYDLSFVEGEGHDALHAQEQGLELATDGYQDAHELAHANDIRRRFKGQEVTNWQIALFGITGGLLPCPAAITVLLICLQLKEISLGAVLVLCFSIGLAITLVTVGTVAAIGSRKARGRWPWLSVVAARAPYLSGALIILVGLYVGWHGAEKLLT